MQTLNIISCQFKVEAIYNIFMEEKLVVADILLKRIDLQFKLLIQHNTFIEDLIFVKYFVNDMFNCISNQKAVCFCFFVFDINRFIKENYFCSYKLPLG